MNPTTQVSVFNDNATFKVIEPEVTDTLLRSTMKNTGTVIHNYRKGGRTSSSPDAKFDSFIRAITKRVNDDRVSQKPALGKLDPYEVLRDIGNGVIAFTTPELIKFGRQIATLQGHDNPVGVDEALDNFAWLANCFVSNEDCHKFLKPADITGEQAISEIVETNESESVIEQVLANAQ